MLNLDDCSALGGFFPGINTVQGYLAISAYDAVYGAVSVHHRELVASV